jgi:hypothetical protein
MDKINAPSRQLFESWHQGDQFAWLLLELKGKEFVLPCIGFIKYPEFAVKFKLNENGGLESFETLSLEDAIRQEAFQRSTIENIKDRLN